MPKLREQDRAVAARKDVEAFKASTDAKKIRQAVQQFPSRILASGLGQTLAFVASKPKGGAEGKVLHPIGDALARYVSDDPKATTVSFLNGVMAGSVATYRQQTREALAYSEWLKRYAAALIEDPEERK